MHLPRAQILGNTHPVAFFTSHAWEEIDLDSMTVRALIVPFPVAKNTHLTRLYNCGMTLAQQLCDQHGDRRNVIQSRETDTDGTVCFDTFR